MLNRWRKFDLLVLAIACVLPTLVTLVYFVWAAETKSSVQQAVYAVAKVVQFGLPIVWVLIAWPERLPWTPSTNPSRGPTGRRTNLGGLSDYALGIGFGLAVAAAMWLLYQTLASTELMEQALAPIREKIAGMGLASPARFLALGVFYSLFHSLLEEYYWRWFVFTGLKQHTRVIPAIAISSVAFSAHHLVVLWTYFSHAPAIALLLTASVAVGGAFWAWLYQRSGSIVPSWMSHLVVDAAIFSLGYHLAAPLFRT